MISRFFCGASACKRRAKHDSLGCFHVGADVDRRACGENIATKSLLCHQSGVGKFHILAPYGGRQIETDSKRHRRNRTHKFDTILQAAA